MKKNKNKNKNNKKSDTLKPVVTLRTLEQRKEEIRKIIEKLDELQLSIDYLPIKLFYDKMFYYIRSGERLLINIPFPEMKKKIEGVLAINILEPCAIRLKYEN